MVGKGAFAKWDIGDGLHVPECRVPPVAYHTSRGHNQESGLVGDEGFDNSTVLDRYASVSICATWDMV